MPAQRVNKVSVYKCGDDSDGGAPANTRWSR